MLLARRGAKCSKDSAAESGFRDCGLGLPGSIPKVSRTHVREGKPSLILC
jgi:hypothetical protein